MRLASAFSPASALMPPRIAWSRPAGRDEEIACTCCSPQNSSQQQAHHCKLPILQDIFRKGDCSQGMEASASNNQHCAVRGKLGTHAHPACGWRSRTRSARRCRATPGGRWSPPSPGRCGGSAPWPAGRSAAPITHISAQLTMYRPSACHPLGIPSLRAAGLPACARSVCSSVAGPETNSCMHSITPHPLLLHPIWYGILWSKSDSKQTRKQVLAVPAGSSRSHR